MKFLTKFVCIVLTFCIFTDVVFAHHPPATLTRYTFGDITLMVLEWNGYGSELFVNWRGNEEFYHNDVPQPYSIIRTAEASDSYAALNIDGENVEIWEYQVNNPVCIIYNFKHGNQTIYRIAVTEFTAEYVRVYYGTEEFVFSPGQYYLQIDRYSEGILEVSVDGDAANCIVAINDDLTNYDYFNYLPVIGK